MAFPLCMHSGLPAEKVEDMIMMSLDDVTMITHASWGGKYIGRAYLGFGAVIWVSGTEWLGSIVKSPTLYSGYIGASSGAGVYSG